MIICKGALLDLILKLLLTGTGIAGGGLLHNLMKNRGPMRKPPSRFVRNLASVDFGEKDGRVHYRSYQQQQRPFASTSSAATASQVSVGTSAKNGSVEKIPPPQEEDESVISMDQNNDDEAILV